MMCWHVKINLQCIYIFDINFYQTLWSSVDLLVVFTVGRKQYWMVRSQVKFTLFNTGKKIHHWHCGGEIRRRSHLGLGENMGRVRSTYSSHMLSFHGLWSYRLNYCTGKKTEDRNVLCFHGPGARNPCS